MKIALVTDTYLPRINGVSTAVTTVAQGLPQGFARVCVPTAHRVVVAARHQNLAAGAESQRSDLVVVAERRADGL